MAKRALGKGLDALFHSMGNEVVNEETGSSLHKIPIDQISANPFQPRKEFSKEEISELAASIKEKGLIQPILVRKHKSAFQIVAGERRYRAVKSLGLNEITAHVRERLSDRDMLEIALIENLQRVQLNPLEEAEGYERLISECGLTHEEAAAKMGKSRSAVTNALRMLKLPEKIKKFIIEGKLTAGHARAILQENPEKHLELAERIISGGLNVRDSERLGTGQKSKKSQEKKKSESQQDPHVSDFLKKLQYSLGTRVNIRGSSKKGILEVHYASQEHLQRLGELLEGKSGV